MFLTFTTSDAQVEAFRTSLTAAAILVTLGCLIAVVATPKKSSDFRLKTIGLLGVIVFLVLAILSFTNTYGEFISAHIEREGIVMHYAGSHGKDVSLTREDIDAVQFGLPSKTTGKCYVKILEKNGASHRSATFPATAEECKRIRIEIMGKLAL